MSIAPPLARWDSGWYYGIAKEGYRYDPHVPQNNIGFYPLYPIVMRAVSTVTRMTLFRAGIAVSLLSLLGALILLASLTREWGQPEEAMPTITSLLAFPSAFFLATAYTESLFLFATTAALLAARRRRWVAAGLAGAAACLTRFNGFLILLPLAWLAFEEAGRTLRLKRPAIAGLAATAAGALAFPAYLWIRWGDPLLYVHSNTKGWQQGPQPIWLLVGRTFGEFVARLRESLSVGRFSFLMMVGSALLFSLLTVIVWRRGLIAEGLYCASNLLLPLSSGTLSGMHRYVLVLFPCFFVLAESLRRRPALAFGYLVFGIGANVILMTRFVHWMFAG
jgi:hypothetical protein